MFGVWRRWLACLHGVQEVVSSSLTTPTKPQRLIEAVNLFLLRMWLTCPHTGWEGREGVESRCLGKSHNSDKAEERYQMMQP